jgi:uncharacterized protein (TIGR03437 family)
MGKLAFYLLVALCLGSQAASAQVPEQYLAATVGVPYNLDLLAYLGLSQAEAADAGFGVSFTNTFTLSGGALPPGLSLSIDGVVSGTPTTPGNYSFTLTFTFDASGDGESTGPVPIPLPVSFEVDPFTGAAVVVDPAAVSFSLNQGATNVITQTILILNRGDQAQTFSAAASSSSAASGWLSVSPVGGAAPFGPSSVTISVNPNGLMAGTYSGAVSISFAPSGQTIVVPVIATVSDNQEQMLVSQNGFRFQTVSGSGAPPSQTLSVLSSGSGSFAFSTSATTVSGGSWLSVSPLSGTATASPSQLVVSVDPTNLAPGDYYGQIQISATGVANSPQIATIVLNVAVAGTDLGAFLQPTGLIFIAQAGGANPAAQSVSLTTPNSAPLAFNAALALQAGPNWLSVQPSSGNVSAASPVQIQVQPAIAGLDAGVYQGDLSLLFSDQTVGDVAVLLILTPGAPGASGQSATMLRPHASVCTPTQLLPVFTLLGSSFATVAAWPTPLAVSIVDDCGNFLTSGSVIASFSSGDPAISLLSLGNGTWTATWQPHTSVPQVTITVQVQEDSPPLEGTASIGGSLEANPSTPVISAGGAVSAASYAAHQPLAPGSFLSIFGANLSAGQNQSQVLPLATQLGATQAILAGEQLPLQFAVDGQVNAIVPYDVPANTTLQLVVMNGPAISMPEPVVIAPAQPAVFTQDLSGQGLGIVVAATPGGTQFEVDANHPISAGDVAIIYCAGLGAVNPPVPAGSAAPKTTLSRTTNTVTVTIGGVNAPVQFAGLAPGYAGLYQVNALIPSGITPGSSVPLVVSAAGQQSTPVTIAVQ